ncbi:MAG TPA: ribosome-associated translation inhibitor RaiA [bacterium]|nr:ribosome-associated translation inhibitor RaiA [bacterium]
MKIKIRAKNLELDPIFREEIKKKFNSLEKFVQAIFENEKSFNSSFGKSKVEMWLEIGKTTKHHKMGKVFDVEAQIRFPGKSIRAVVVSEDLRSSINQVKNELQRAFKKYKEKRDAEYKKGKREFKSSIMF